MSAISRVLVAHPDTSKGLTVLAADLRLGNDQLQRVRIVGVGNGVVENADSLEQVSSDTRLTREVGRVSEDLLGFGLELHSWAGVVLLLHSSLDTDDLATIVEELVDISVEHICTTVDSRETSEALRKFAQAVQRVDVRRLAVACHRVDIETNALDCFVCGALLVDVVVGLVQGHGVTDEVTSCGLQSELVVDVLHGAVLHIKTYIYHQQPATSHTKTDPPLCVAASSALYAPTHSRKLRALRFSKRPISGERRASPASEGTLATVALVAAPC